MPPPAPATEFRLTFRRRANSFLFASGAVLAGLVGVALYFFGPVPSAGDAEPTSFPLIALGVACAGIWVAVLPNFLWGVTSGSRYFLLYFSTIAAGAVPIANLSPRWELPSLILAVVGAALLALYEIGLTVEVTSLGIRRTRRFPVPGVRDIPWERVDTVTADLRKITTYGTFGTTVENESRARVAGNGTAFTFKTTRFLADGGDVELIVDQAQAHAIAATLRRVRQDGSARLGPITLRRDAILCSRLALHGGKEIHWIFHVLGGLLTMGLWLAFWWISSLVGLVRGPREIPLGNVQRVTFADGSVRIETGSNVYHLTLRRVPNGVYLPEIAHGLQHAATGAVDTMAAR
jgi:hypothetical protein